MKDVSADSVKVDPSNVTFDVNPIKEKRELIIESNPSGLFALVTQITNFLFIPFEVKNTGQPDSIDLIFITSLSASAWRVSGLVVNK